MEEISVTVLRKSNRFMSAIAILLSLGVVFEFPPQASHGGQPRFACRPPETTRAPLISGGIAHPIIRYRVGQELRSEAAATYGFRQSDEYIELQQLRGFRAGIESLNQVMETQTRMSALETTTRPAGHVTPEKSRSQETSAPTSPYPTLSQQCGQCHSGDSPKGDVWLDGSVRYDTPEMAEKRDAIVHAVRTGLMPPSLNEGERLSPEIREEIEDEVHGVKAE
ncbi:hypothetical protein [Lacipirellula parvula]|uniref:hypothetical protein n=1 Tax=Lacipirellula parvula TaxID=2650471 RepID=UPI001260B90C|nr:hypothetical protein [Lacipirellula parvula]